MILDISQKIVYEEVCKNLQEGEYIIKKAFEHNAEGIVGNGQYNVCYISNIGSVIYSCYNQKYKRFDFPVKKLLFIDKRQITISSTILDEFIIEQIVKHTFTSNHYFKLSKELSEFIKTVNDFQNDFIGYLNKH